MGKYSLIGFYTLILHDIIDRRYVHTGNLSCLSIFLILYILHTNKKKVFKGLRYHKSRTNIMAHKSWKQHKSKKIL